MLLKEISLSALQNIKDQRQDRKAELVRKSEYWKKEVRCPADNTYRKYLSGGSEDKALARTGIKCRAVFRLETGNTWGRTWGRT